MFKLFIGIFIVILSSFIGLIFIDRRVNKILSNYIDIEVERYINNVAVKAVRDKTNNLYSDNNYIDKDNISSMYDVIEINRIRNDIEKIVQDEMKKLEDGEKDDYFIPMRLKTGRFKNIRNGILCDVSLGSIRGSSLFANVGPTIPIKLLFTGQVNSDIEVKTKEYGINNAIMEIYIVFKIKEQAIMPLSSKTKTIVLREPITINIINGNIPNYYGMYTK